MITPEEVKEKLPENFWNKVKFDDVKNCWEWQASRSENGYGKFMTNGTKNNQSHRFIFAQLFGEIPNGILILHECDNRKCVNPNHLRAGTQQDNMDDMIRKGRYNYSGRAKGSKNGKSKLTEADVLIIKARLKNGELQRVIAASFGVTHSAIEHIHLGLTWKHIQI